MTSNNKCAHFSCGHHAEESKLKCPVCLEGHYIPDPESYEKAFEKANEAAEQKFIPLLTNATYKIKELETNLASQLAKTNKLIEDAKKQADESKILAIKNIQILLEKERLDRQLEKNKDRVEKESLIKRIEELNQKVNQGSMQSQGEAGEELVKENLIKKFVDDTVEDIGKGKRGADLLLNVKLPNGTDISKILFEVKNTSSFSHGWIEKGKEDQQNAGADAFLLITKAMPKDMLHFGFIDGTLVTSFYCYIPLVALIRNHLITIYQNQQVSTVKESIPELLYQYVASTNFTRDFEVLHQIYSDSKDDLDKEKRTIQKFWNSREQSLTKMLTSLESIYTGCKEIVGTAMPIVDGLE